MQNQSVRMLENTKKVLYYWPKILKNLYKRGRLSGYKALLRGIRTYGRSRKPRQPTIIIAGDAGAGNGPFKFLVNFCTAQQRNYKIILSFRSNEITAQLRLFCKSRSIKLIPRPPLPDAIDVIALQIIGLVMGVTLFIINAASFPGNLHFIACHTPTIYYSHSTWHRAIDKREKWTLTRFLDRQHRLLTVSRSAFESLLNNYFENSTQQAWVSWVYNWVPDTYQQSCHIDKFEKIIVLTIGTITSYKNPILWAKVARKVLALALGNRPIEFWWAGIGPLLSKAMQIAAGR